MSIYLICIYFLVAMMAVSCVIFMWILIGNRYKMRKVTIENLKQKKTSLYVKYDLKTKEMVINSFTCLNLDISRYIIDLSKEEEFDKVLKEMIKQEEGEYYYSKEINGKMVYLNFSFREKIEDFVVLRCDYTIENIVETAKIKSLNDVKAIHESYENKKACMYYFNVKEFNSINQRYGEKCGDYVLEVIKERILKEEKNNVSCCYLGADQFIIYYNNKRINKKKALKLIRSINKKITKPVDVGYINIDLNFGIGLCVGDYDNIDEYVKRAYVAADYAKKRKRYNVVIYNDNMKLEDDLIDAYEQELNDIITTKDLSVNYSPVFYNKKSKFVGYISNPVFSNSTINYNTLKIIASQRAKFDRLMTTVIDSQLVSYLKKRPKKSSKLFLKLKLEDLPAFLETYLSNPAYSDCKIVIYLDVKKGYEMLNKYSYISSTISKIVDEGIEIASELNYSNMYNYDYILKNSTYLVLDESIVSNMNNILVKNRVLNVIELAKTYDLDLLAVDVREYIQYENLLKYDVNYFSGTYFGKNVKKPNEIEQSKTKIFAKFIKDSKKGKKN